MTNKAFIIIQPQSAGRLLMSSPFIPELVTEACGFTESVRRLSDVLLVVLRIYEAKHTSIPVPGELRRRGAARTHRRVAKSRLGRPLIEIRPETDGRFLLTSPIIPELVTEGRGMTSAIAKLSDAIRIVIKMYDRRGTDLESLFDRAAES